MLILLNLRSTNNKVVGLMTEWIQNNTKVQRTADSDKGRFYAIRFLSHAK